MIFLNENVAEKYNTLVSFEDLCENDLAEIITKKIEREDIKLLDLGGGTGKFSNHFRNKSKWDITIGDFSQTMLDQAKLNKYKTLTLDINNLNLNEKFDVILIKFCIHYVSKNKKFFDSISKCLNSNGKIFIITRPKFTEFPHTEKLHAKWAKSQPLIEEIIAYSETYFEKNTETLKFPISMKLNDWNKIIINKMFSHIEDEDAEEAKALPESEEMINFNDNIILIELTLI
jgi:ubiquinone/menaquinone biosynthesis C-methylase UbiE